MNIIKEQLWYLWRYLNLIVIFGPMDWWMDRGMKDWQTLLPTWSPTASTAKDYMTESESGMVRR